jgi:hypothetical protein
VAKKIVTTSVPNEKIDRLGGPGLLGLANRGTGGCDIGEGIRREENPLVVDDEALDVVVLAMMRSSRATMAGCSACPPRGMRRRATCEGSEERRLGLSAEETVTNPTARVIRGLALRVERRGAGRDPVEGTKKKLAQCVEAADAAGVGLHVGGGGAFGN